MSRALVRTSNSVISSKTGFFKIPAKYTSAHPFYEGLAAASGNCAASRFGFIGHDGNWKIRPDFGGADLRFAEGLAAVSQGGLWGYIDPSGALQIPYHFDYADHFHNSRAVVGVKRNGMLHYGFISKTGDFVMPPQFAHAAAFRGSLAWVVDENDFSSYMDLNGQFVWRSTEKRE